MSIPDPKVGLVINYGYLWKHQAQSNLEEGRNRPCLIIEVDNQKGHTIVTVQPITTKGDTIGSHDGIEVPQDTKARLGLDTARQSKIITSECNKFEWPGYDLGTVPKNSSSKFDYGLMPERITEKAIDQAYQHSLTREFTAINRDTSPPKIEKPTSNPWQIVDPNDPSDDFMP